MGKGGRRRHVGRPCSEIDDFSRLATRSGRGEAAGDVCGVFMYTRGHSRVNVRSSVAAVTDLLTWAGVSGRSTRENRTAAGRTHTSWLGEVVRTGRALLRASPMREGRYMRGSVPGSRGQTARARKSGESNTPHAVKGRRTRGPEDAEVGGTCLPWGAVEEHAADGWHACRSSDGGRGGCSEGASERRDTDRGRPRDRGVGIERRR